MKSIIKHLLIIFLLSTSAGAIFAQDNNINLLAEFSLFHEDHKNHLFESALPHGWIVVNTDASQFIKYRIFPKMEEILWFMHDSVATGEEEKLILLDTLLYLYDRAIEQDDEKRKNYFRVRRVFAMNTLGDFDYKDIISEYESAFSLYPDATVFYKDRLGLLYIEHKSEENYQVKAIELYSELQEREPDNALWVERMKLIADDIDQLVEVYKKAWDLDKENPEKAWQYASACLRAKQYDTALEPLEFLVDKSPDVINYWTQLANAYDKDNQTSKALNAYKKLIELQPNNRDNYANIALLYKKLDQLSVARSYLQKASNASSEPWDFPYFIEAQLYEQAGRNCTAGGSFEFEDKCVYQLAVDTYKKARSISGSFANQANERIKALNNSIPSQEDYFFRQLKSGDSIKIEGKCYNWISRRITVP